MKRLLQRRRIRHVGGRTVSERTDPDYDDKRIAIMREEFQSLNQSDRSTYLAGLSAQDKKLVLREE